MATATIAWLVYHLATTSLGYVIACYVIAWLRHRLATAAFHSAKRFAFTERSSSPSSPGEDEHCLVKKMYRLKASESKSAKITLFLAGLVFFFDVKVLRNLFRRQGPIRTLPRAAAAQPIWLLHLPWIVTAAPTVDRDRSCCATSSRTATLMMSRQH
jgi:hypothetical protein